MKTASCPYGTYQRSTSGMHLALITPKKLFRAMHKRLKPSVRRSTAFRAARHSLLRGALEHLKEDRAIYRMAC